MKHLDQKYFSYRLGKVAAAVARYPDRAGVLMASEYLRLGFMGIGSVLCAAILGILAYTAGPRVGWFDWRTITFLVLAFFSAAIVLRVIQSFVKTIRYFAAERTHICHSGVEVASNAPKL